MLSLLIFLTLKNETMVWGLEQILTLGPELCQKALPPSAWFFLNSALVCGVKLPPGPEKQMFLDTGLIHLMVVSGSHLVFIELLIQRFPQSLRVLLLAAYCFFTGFQAPVVRAFLRRLISPFFKSHFKWTPLQVDLAAVVLALSIYPQWFFSRSFLMSWMCSLALLLPKIWPKAQHFDQAVKSYFFLLPFCWAAPITVFWNTLLAPFVGLILFPVCLLSIALPGWSWISDAMWVGFLSLLQQGPQCPPLPIFLETRFLSGLPVITHLALVALEVRWRRASAFS